MKWGKYVGWIVLVIAVLAVGFKFGDWWRTRQSVDAIAKLSTQLQKTTETLEITTGLYSKQSYAYENLTKYLSYKTDETAALQKELEKSRADLLTANQLTLKWKKAYEAVLAANQTEEPPADSGGPTRKRVDFSGRLGPIQASGHTLTDPAEAFLKLEQVIPLKLTVAVAQNRDKTWTTFVTSSDPNIDVKVDLAGVNPLVISPKWYQRIWMDLGAAALGDPAGYLGLSWRGDRLSVGGMCYASGGSMNGCGATLGVRLFK
jgi:hypothetical protein